MFAREAMELTKKYATCPECGNDKVGGEPSQGALIIEDDVFTRSCKCGWSVTVDKRIKVHAHSTKKLKGVTTGIVEISFHDKAGRKYVDMNVLKQFSGAKRSNQTKLMEDWLNTKEGREWALNTPHISNFF
ncbi:DUF3797 domain-containing protein [Metasolibacillus meyeri]|uniref:DUF3797 domain-containing protein n=1 Tax=Metasolibacillus meyeri TaxID=1071052 RepID=A0AAW9NMD0_9BACL|nr:DUF3797 domain-containing protein [Metasolibacillus meyeri]MEC1177642.1 DUF3797 domain-containing protein [Metasolibacillus meyeri]